ncbi:MAG: hypothetical protein AAGI44_08575 [Pseudomonadota bacterium]
MPEQNPETNGLVAERSRLENQLLEAEVKKLNAESRKLDAQCRQINDAIDKEAERRRLRAIMKAVGYIVSFVSTLTYIIVKHWLDHGG